VLGPEDAARGRRAESGAWHLPGRLHAVAHTTDVGAVGGALRSDVADVLEDEIGGEIAVDRLRLCTCGDVGNDVGRAREVAELPRQAVGALTRLRLVLGLALDDDIQAHHRREHGQRRAKHDQRHE